MKKTKTLLLATTLTIAVTLIGCGATGGGCPSNMTDPGASVLLTVSSEQTGEMISFIGPTDVAGNGSEATAAVYQLPDGRTYTIFLGADGQVSEIVANGVVFKFTNWTTSSVLLTLYEGSSSANATIPINNPGGKPRYSVMQSRGESLRRLARSVSNVGCGLSVVKGTLVTLFTEGAGALIAIPMVALGCDSVLANLLGVELPPGWTEANCAIALGSGQWDTAAASCGSAALNHLADYEDAKATTAGTQEDDCPNDPNKTEPGICGCGTPDNDSDGDGTPDCNDGCPNDSNKTASGNCGCGNPESPGCGSSLAVVIETVPVGNLGNADDTYGDGYGGVAYTYNIGKYEVTAGQYTAFLNAVAASDTYGLYNTNMDSNTHGCQITQNGTDGDYTYDFSGRPSGMEADWVDRPVNYVSWGDAARFVNWLHNGQPTGAQDLTTTEDGSYYINGAMSDPELLAIAREPDATWVIPSEDEWYKAAYHKNDGVTGDYWDYPTKSDTAPTSEAPPGTNMTNGSANYDFAISAPYYRTEAGAFSARPSDSPYGTFDQGGNVEEWNEAASGSYRVLRGSSYLGLNFLLRAGSRYIRDPTLESVFTGFRVAKIP